MLYRRTGAVAALVSALAAASIAGAGAPRLSPAAPGPNDPYWPAEQSLQHVGLPEAWRTTVGSARIVIAVVDTGVDPIPDLDGALVPGWDFVDGDAVPEDGHGHGTAVASLIAARGDDGRGIAGVCWGCLVMPVRVARTGTTSADLIARGIRWAADHGARVVNVSLEGGDDPAEADAVAYAQRRGALVIASAGNGGDARPGYPAAYPGVVSVAATGPDDRLYPWSTRGDWVSLAAPGCSVVDDPGAAAPTSLCGTSLAPPIVSGIAGLLLSARPTLDAASLAAALRAGAVPVAGIGGGRVAAGVAMQALSGAPAGSSASTPVSEARLLRGTMRAHWRAAVELAPGPFQVELRSRRVEACRLEVRGPDAVLVGLAVGPDEIRASDDGGGGRYLVVLACPGAARRSFTLLVYGRVPG